MTMWTLNGDVESDVSGLPDIDLANKRRRSRRHAWRDGLADETVVRDFEDVRAYRAFERALVGSIDPRTAIELALVHRLANLLWRLGRASAIETGLFEIQGEPPIGGRQDPSRGPSQSQALSIPTRLSGHSENPGSNGPNEPPANDREPPSTSMRPPLEPCSKSRTIAECFLRLSDLDPTLLDRVGRYEGRLWRQAAQTIWTLEAMRRPQLAPTQRSFRKPAARLFWNSER
jgi:hypothetical protein